MSLRDPPSFPPPRNCSLTPHRTSHLRQQNVIDPSSAIVHGKRSAHPGAGRPFLAQRARVDFLFLLPRDVTHGTLAAVRVPVVHHEHPAGLCIGRDRRRDVPAGILLRPRRSHRLRDPLLQDRVPVPGQAQGAVAGGTRIGSAPAGRTSSKSSSRSAPATAWPASPSSSCLFLKTET